MSLCQTCRLVFSQKIKRIFLKKNWLTYATSSLVSCSPPVCQLEKNSWHSFVFNLAKILHTDTCKTKTTRNYFFLFVDCRFRNLKKWTVDLRACHRILILFSVLFDAQRQQSFRELLFVNAVPDRMKSTLDSGLPHCFARSKQGGLPFLRVLILTFGFSYTIKIVSLKFWVLSVHLIF